MASLRHDPWVALPAGADPRREAAELARIHASVAADPGGDAPALRPTIRASWQRSAARGARPDGAGAPAVLSEAELEDRRAHHPLGATLPALRDLLRAGGDGLDHIVVISDADGVLLWVEGPPRQLSRAADEMNFVPGSDWSEAGVGTNSIGTAIAADHAVQVFSAEHYNAACHRWTCSGAPVHDPATGAVLGAIDLTTDLRRYHPVGHQLVVAAARVAEGVLADELRRRDARLVDHYLAEVAHRHPPPSAIASPDGRVLAALPPGWVTSRLGAIPTGGGPLARQGVLAQPVLGGAGHVLTPLPEVSDTAAILRGGTAGPTVRLEALGRHAVVVRAAGRRTELSVQHSELVVLLALHPDGLHGGELAALLDTSAANVQKALSRLRTVLGDALLARPYRLADHADVDLWEVREELAAGHHDAAARAYRGPLLPSSRLPAIAAERDRLATALLEADLGDTGGFPPAPF